MELDTKSEIFQGNKFYNRSTKKYPKGKIMLFKTKGRCATFQTVMRMTNTIGQIFALNPVLGIWEIDYYKLRFTYMSARCLYTMISIIGQAVFVIFCIYNGFKSTQAHLSSGTSLIFYGSNCLTTILFLRISMQWPSLCRSIAKTEVADPNHDLSLIRRCNISCVVILSLALLEHVLADVAGFAVAMDCDPDKNLYEAFVVAAFPWVFKYVTYNHFIGTIAMIVNTQCTFNWNFADLFVICISLYLSSRLEQVNKRIISIKGKYIPSTLWRSVREDYCRAAQLVRKVDDVINGVIFVSFANNLFFICVQLLHTLEDGLKGAPACNSRVGGPLKGYEHAVYFMYSLVFLISRSLAVSLIAARVHSATLEAAPALYEVPSSVYSIEVQRLLDQINGDTVALSGLKFFNVKRGLVLTIAGTIVTYELVLIQFTGVSPPSPDTNLLFNTTSTTAAV